MGNSKKRTVQISAPVVAAPAKVAKVAAVPAVSPKISVVATAKPVFRTGSARDAYWQMVAKHNGKTLADLEKAVAAEPPSMPKKGKLAGQAEPLSGWVRWFVRHGFITLAA